jgi:hypothetical protein
MKRSTQFPKSFWEVASSWLGSDVHVPIFSEQLHALFGTSVLRVHNDKTHAIANATHTLNRGAHSHLPKRWM